MRSLINSQKDPQQRQPGLTDCRQSRSGAHRAHIRARQGDFGLPSWMVSWQTGHRHLLVFALTLRSLCFYSSSEYDSKPESHCLGLNFDGYWVSDTISHRVACIPEEKNPIALKTLYQEPLNMHPSSGPLCVTVQDQDSENQTLKKQTNVNTVPQHSYHKELSSDCSFQFDASPLETADYIFSQ